MHTSSDQLESHLSREKLARVVELEVRHVVALRPRPATTQLEAVARAAGDCIAEAGLTRQEVDLLFEAVAGSSRPMRVYPRGQRAYIFVGRWHDVNFVKFLAMKRAAEQGWQGRYEAR